MKRKGQNKKVIVEDSVKIFALVLLFSLVILFKYIATGCVVMCGDWYDDVEYIDPVEINTENIA